MSRDNPEWSKKDFLKAARYARVPLKQLAEAITRKRGRPKLENPKESIKLRIDADVLAAYRKTGTGWQTMINRDLRKARKLKAS